MVSTGPEHLLHLGQSNWVVADIRRFFLQPASCRDCRPVPAVAGWSGYSLPQCGWLKNTNCSEFRNFGSKRMRSRAVELSCFPRGVPEIEIPVLGIELVHRSATCLPGIWCEANQASSRCSNSWWAAVQLMVWPAWGTSQSWAWSGAAWAMSCE